MFVLASFALWPLSLALVVIALFCARKYKRPNLLSASLQILLILGAVGVWFAVSTAAYLAGPPDGDLYAQTWSFQGIVFVLTYLPLALAVSGAVVIAETVFLQRPDHAL